MPTKCTNCGGRLELWSLSGKITGDVKSDGASFICKECGMVQPDEVLRNFLSQKKQSS